MSNELMAIENAAISPVGMGAVGNLLLNTQQLNTIGKFAKMYSRSTMVPQNYQGNEANCFIALELAARMNVSPVMVMQNLYIVHGKPSWSGQACVALINGCGLFGPLEFVAVGDVGAPGYGCYAKATRLSTGNVIKGPTVTMQMAADEGWLNKSGSKWKTMPELMIRYRAAAFFARTECPNVLMGYYTVDEIEDIHGAQIEPQKVVMKLEKENKS